MINISSRSAARAARVDTRTLAGLIGTDVAHKWYYVPIVYSIYCAVALLALVFIRETRDVGLEELDR
jgi:hypothetical protein